MLIDLNSYWGANRLQKYKPFFLTYITIPQASKDVLQRVGLPIVSDPLFRFVPEEPPFPRIDTTICCWRIGFYNNSGVCVREGDGVILIYDEMTRTTKYMNSSLERFAILLTIYQQMLIECRPVDQSQRIAIVSEAESQMQSIDLEAFTDEEFFWPVVFEQIGYELY